MVLSLGCVAPPECWRVGSVDTWIDAGGGGSTTDFDSSSGRTGPKPVFDRGHSDEDLWDMRGGVSLNWSPSACEYVTEDVEPARLLPGGRRR